MLRRSEYEIGDFLVTDDGMVFIHDGYINGDGYGCVIGMIDATHVMRSKEYTCWMKGCNVRKATDEEKSMLITRIMYNENIPKY